MEQRTRAVAAILALCVLAAVAWWSLRSRGADVGAGLPPRSEAAASETPQAGLEPLSSAQTSAERRELAAAVELPAAVAPARLLHRGRVQTADGAPVAGIDVFLGGPFGDAPEPEPLAVTDATGEFAWGALAWSSLVAESEELTTVLPAFTSASASVIVVAPRRDYSGVAVDERDVGLEGVELAVEMDDATARALLPGEARALARRWSAQSRADGSFALAGVGWTQGLTLLARRAGFEPAREELPEGSSHALVLRMRREIAGERSLTGVVVDESSRAVEGAKVGFVDGSETASDREGRFVVEWPEGASSAVLWAVKRGHLPARRELDLDAARGDLVLVLGGEPPAIAGRVVELDGRAVERAHVFTWDFTHWTRSTHWVETALTSNNFPGQASTDADGRFRLDGLLPNPYAVRAIHPRTLEVAERVVDAGTTDLELRFTGSELARRVAGHVVDCRGEPVSGVILFCGRTSSPGVRDLYSPLITAGAPITDEQGAFEFPALCVEGTYLLPSGGDIAGQNRIPLDPASDLEHLTITVSRFCRFQIELASAAEDVDHFHVLDGDDQRMQLAVVLGNVMMGGNAAFDLAGGRSEVMQCDERARTLVLSKGETEVRRVPIQLVPGELQILRP